MSTSQAWNPAPWRWPLLLRASVAGHVAAAVAVVLYPSFWPWALAAVIADHGLITFAGLWPRCSWLGPNLVRLPAAACRRYEVAVTIDDGPDPAVTPAVLDLLDAAGAKATFFCIAERACAHPDLIRDIVRRGHSVENHSRDHSHAFSLMGRKRLAREVGGAQDQLQQLAGAAPRFFRAPAGLRNPFLEPELRRHGLRLASWTRRGFDTRVGDPQRVLARLTHGLQAGDILLLHDGHAATTPAGRAVVLEVLPLLLQACRRAGLTPVTMPQAMRGEEGG
jgi:peptidoglycan/xylan/chitin deacetylase (PgdA/CDA1 family)